MPIEINLAPIGKLEEIIKPLVFRDKVDFEISKNLREKAYTMALDVVINTTAASLYQSGKSSPPTQFYGYAVLVFQDMLSLEIPIHFPRQRLYYAVQEEAIRQWRHWIEFYQNYQLHRQSKADIDLIAASFDIPLVEYQLELAKNAWIELPLREVHIKLLDGTQATIEYIQYSPVLFSDPITGADIDGKSSQPDGDKDKGLPRDGIQPYMQSPDSPFLNNPPVTSVAQALASGLPLISDSNLSSVNPDNISIAPPVLTGQRLGIGSSYITSYDGNTPVLLSETSRPNPSYSQCYANASLSMILVDAVQTNRGTANIFNLTVNGTVTAVYQFLDTSSDYVIEPC